MIQERLGSAPSRRAGRFCPSPARGTVRVGATAKEGWTHHPDDLAKQLCWLRRRPSISATRCAGRPNVEGLLQDLGGLLRLSEVALKAFSRGTAAALSGFGAAFLIGFALIMVCCSKYGLCRAAFLAGAWDCKQGSRVRHCLGAARRTRRRSIMDFCGAGSVLALLRQRSRVSYRALKRQFDLDDAYLDDLKVELIEVQQCARDQEGTMLVWTGQDASAAAPAPVVQAPLVYTPPHLAEKILTPAVPSKVSASR